MNILTLFGSIGIYAARSSGVPSEAIDWWGIFLKNKKKG